MQYKFRSQSHPIKLLLVFVAALLAWSMFIFSEQASGLSTKYFDDNGPSCDISDCGASVKPVVGETRFVQISEVNVRAYFDSPNGEVTIYGSNFCPGAGEDQIQPGDEWSNQGGLNNGATVTNFEATWNYSQGRIPLYSDTIKGERWGANGNYGPCNNDKSFTIRADKPMTRNDTGKYFVDIKVTHIDQWGGRGVADGIQNTFTMSQTGGAAFRIVQRGGDNQNPSGYDATVEQTAIARSCDPAKDPGCNFLNYYIKFGTPCQQTSNKAVKYGLYDLDNKDDTGAQEGRIVKVKLFENGNLIDSWTPAGGDNRALTREFVSQPGAKYRLVIEDVYKNNTIQYSTPFDGIYYEINCPSPPQQKDQPPTGSVTADCSLIRISARDPDTSADLRVDILIDGSYKTTIYPPGGYQEIPRNTLSGDDFVEHTVTIIIYGKNRAGNEDASEPGQTVQRLGNFGPCPPPISCGSYKSNPADPEPGQPFNVDVTATYPGVSSAGVPNNPPYYFRIVLNGVVYNNVGFNPNPGGTSSTTSANVLVPWGLPDGNYTINWSMEGPGIPGGGNCPGTIKVAKKPYLRVYGGDVRAGAVYAPGCSGGGTGGIFAFNKGSGSGPPYLGSGTQVAAFAMAAIQEFVSANERGSPPIVPRGLTFANDGGAEYGGSFGAPACIPDYWAGNNNVVPSYQVNNPLDLGPNTQQVHYVAGNAIINSNVNFVGSPWDVNSLPSYWVIVRGGNIYIDNSVTNLAGVYIALPDENNNGGNIYTCAIGGVVPSPAQVATTCGSNKLVVRGSFIAQSVKLLRTINTLLNSDAADANYQTSKAAEDFIYSPEMWLKTPPLTNSRAFGNYDAVTSMPPIL